MKKAIMLVAVAICTVLFFIGCEKGSTQKSYCLDSVPGVKIVKFKDPSDANRLIVSDYSKFHPDDSCTCVFSLMRGNWCERTHWKTFWHNDADEKRISGDWDFDFSERLRDPFWALPDGWYLIDWAWHGLWAEIAYPYDGNTILTDITFDNYYQKVDYNEFDCSVPHVSKDNCSEIFEERIIHLPDLMAYIYPDGNYPSYKLREYDKIEGYDRVVVYPNLYWYFSRLSGMRPVSKYQSCLCEIADEMDSLWAFFQSQITTLINNGDLDDLPEVVLPELFPTPEDDIK